MVNGRALIAIIIIAIVFLVGIKALNATSSKVCSIDIDCVIYKTQCCTECDMGESVSKFYTGPLTIEKAVYCSTTVMCPKMDCIDLPIIDPVCNQNMCDTKINCEKTCDALHKQLEQFEGREGFEDYIPQRIDEFNEEFGCNC
ncbi:MAG: hypothetical protein ABIJ92_03700 [Candidatus Aenigmatarchaeota archaeon]